jgi:hypothetical protein
MQWSTKQLNRNKLDTYLNPFKSTMTNAWSIARPAALLEAGSISRVSDSALTKKACQCLSGKMCL